MVRRPFLLCRESADSARWRDWRPWNRRRLAWAIRTARRQETLQLLCGILRQSRIRAEVLAESARQRSGNVPRCVGAELACELRDVEVQKRLQLRRHVARLRGLVSERANHPHRHV